MHSFEAYKILMTLLYVRLFRSNKSKSRCVYTLSNLPCFLIATIKIPLHIFYPPSYSTTSLITLHEDIVPHLYLSTYTHNSLHSTFTNHCIDPSSQNDLSIYFWNSFSFIQCCMCVIYLYIRNWQNEHLFLLFFF